VWLSLSLYLCETAERQFVKERVVVLAKVMRAKTGFDEYVKMCSLMTDVIRGRIIYAGGIVSKRLGVDVGIYVNMREDDGSDEQDEYSLCTCFLDKMDLV
jgi:hypothetical protein